MLFSMKQKYLTKNLHDSYRQKFTKLSNQFNNDVLVNIAGNFSDDELLLTKT